MEMLIIGPSPKKMDPYRPLLPAGGHPGEMMHAIEFDCSNSDSEAPIRPLAAYVFFEFDSFPFGKLYLQIAA
jgi:hypothetical protein